MLKLSTGPRQSGRRMRRWWFVAALVLVGAGVAVPAYAAEEPGVDPGAEATRVLQQQGYSTAPEDFLPSEATPSLSSADSSSATETVTLRSSASGYAVVCKGTTSSNAVRDPHYSKGAGGAIFKTVLKCTGTGLASVKVRTQGLLTFAPSASSTNTNVTFSRRASSDQTQTITVNGAEKTYYTPKTGLNGGRGTGYWRATSTWYFVVDGKYSTVGSHTKTVWKAI